MSGSSRGLKFYWIMADGEAVSDDDIAELIRDTIMAKTIGSKVHVFIKPMAKIYLACRY